MKNIESYLMEDSQDILDALAKYSPGPVYVEIVEDEIFLCAEPFTVEEATQSETEEGLLDDIHKMELDEIADLEDTVPDLDLE